MLADSFNDTNVKNPIKQTIVSYFKGKGLFEDLSDTQITKIANQFGNLTVQRQVEAEAKKIDKKELADIVADSIETTIENPNDYKAILVI